MEFFPEIFLEDLVYKYDIFLLDLDGVIWNGEEVIKGSFEAIKYIYEKGKKIFFISNGCTHTQREYVAKFHKLGMDIPLQHTDFYTSGYTTAIYLQEKCAEIKKVYIIGQNGLAKELEQVGIEVLGGEIDTGKIIEVDSGIQAVILGSDENLNYYKLMYATLCVQRGAIFIVTNPDAFDVTINGKIFPEAGSTSSIIKRATGVDPIYIGKPNSIVIDILLLKENLGDDNTHRMVMIGDRLNTDIELGYKPGVDTVCVFTGVTTPTLLQKILEEHNSRIHDHSPFIPKYIFPRLGHFKSPANLENEQ